MDQLTSLRIFREVVDAGSFTAASNRLSISAPMVSKHLAQLERRLGVRLLHRTSRRLRLTTAGQIYHEQCCAALDVLDAAAESVGRASESPFGELKVSAPVWCATARFARILERYRRRYPDVLVDMHLDNRTVDLVAEGFDLALRATAEPSPALIARPLCSVRFILVASPGFMRQLRASTEKGMLAPVPTILPNYLPRERIDAMSFRSKMTPLTPAMKSSDTTLSYHAVVAGIGAGLLPDWLVGDDLATGRLERLDSERPSFEGTLFAVYASRKQMLPKVRTFIDFLNEALGPDAVN